MSIAIVGKGNHAGVETLDNMDISLPWSFFNMHDGVIVNDSVTTASDRATGSGAINGTDLDMNGTLGTCWSANPNWATFTGAADHNFFLDIVADTSYDTLVRDEGNCLIWAQINNDFSAGSITSPCWFMMGNGVTAGAAIRCMVLRSTGALRVQYKAQGGSNVTRTLFGATIQDNVDTVLALYLDYRAVDGVIQGYICDDNGVTALSPSSFSVLPDLETNSISRLAVGSSYNNATPTAPWEGQLRRVGMIQFGSSTPSNITDLVTDLHNNKGIPGWAFDSL